MQTRVNSIEKFAESFFNNLGCNIKWIDEELIVDEVPKKFEAFVGKKGPYRFVFRDELLKIYTFNTWKKTLSKS